MADTESAYYTEQDMVAKNGSLDNGQTVKHGGERGSPAPAKKKRRVVKPNPDKKFECRHEGCGKSYSRAEHLYRHQLNHTPKTIYRCDYPECSRYFVRQDLCVRHRERHTTHGSQLHKRGTFAQSTSNPNGDPAPAQHQLAQAPSYSMPAPAAKTPQQEPRSVAAASVYSRDAGNFKQHSRISSSTVSPSTASTEPRFQPRTPHAVMARPEPTLHRASSTGDPPLSPTQRQEFTSWSSVSRRQSFNTGDTQTGHVQYAALQSRESFSGNAIPQSPVRQYSVSSATNIVPVRSHSDTMLDRQDGFVQQTDMSSVVAYSSAGYPPGGVSQTTDAAFAAAVSHGLTRAGTYPYPGITSGMPHLDMHPGYGFPVFGAEEFTQTPFAVDDFTQWLFNDANSGSNGFSPPNYVPGYSGHEQPQMQGPYTSQSPSSNGTYPGNPMQHPMSVTSILDSTNTSQYIMSESKRHELLDIMQTQFVERPHDAVKKRKASVFEGDIDSDGHILSLRMMHTYIGSYWYHQHAQLPILHKPTFSADRTSNLLLLAVIAIGAATLDKAYGTSLTDSAAEFANFVAWHIRWEIMRDADFRPPAKLWVFQTLLLIEVYEKMYATRALHERAHIHHDSTLTLMRRGSSLLGRSASDSPPSLRGEQDNGRISVPFSGKETVKTEESWYRWIATEATRRAAFGAFVIDSIHATMFGHAAKMVAHEMRLPLPCDEGLWSAVSAAEAGRVQTSLQTNGVKPIMFLDGLKKTLNGQKVRTNSFGRTIIMAGLLSVSWHMTQRDLQISSLGPRTANSFGGPDKWKATLLRAFDNWKRDFDEALAEAAPTPASPLRTNAGPFQGLLPPVDDENIFESRTVLHHLAHIAAHVDVVDCQVFAGANRLLGRSITPKDYSVIREKIERWATKASARDAAFYALKFMAQVLIPPDDPIDGINRRLYGHASPILPQAFEQNQYIARDDFLLNRPWVLYISALVVWCYGFALEGPIKPPPAEEDFVTYRQKEQDMRDYLERVGGARAPDDLENVKDKNRCLGLLMILKESFESTRWELTHEAAGLLGNACLKLRGVESHDIVGPETSDLSSSELSHGAHNGYLNGHSQSDLYREDSREHLTVASAAKV
ncbi:hypothetical protein LTS07_003763 [Exophiala sideris]|uniref:C2H2-type domain-containing protein n=1 Tax=Exophiala sideris TaxID=1016849 RepID=A0ABR0JH17_9EURO|nr:hypothetical protein LTS07_003763 [Exophiala sideris]KAK5042046.1 hypothetical protein LTR13_001852 [Exophiala sideris]KAK5064003.1 hypothetical protein LTR69_003771 [Exophiala sideris]KAK5185314.1 hypothetical protein LTR44_002303 [Eurotiomycetes sp. CCFEE 6388]